MTHPKIENNLSTKNHKTMPAKTVFKLNNNFSQATARGICTAASLAWARACLKKRGHINSFSEIGPDRHALNAQMAVLRGYDHNPRKQTELAGLELVSEPAVSSLDDVISKVKASSTGVAIFWTQFHTMGYRYVHNDKEFFDMEAGLFRSRYTKHIKAKMEEIFKRGYGQVKGCRIVRLP